MAKGKVKKMPKRENDFHLFAFVASSSSALSKEIHEKRVLGLHVNPGPRFDCKTIRLRTARNSLREVLD